jgi:hypothetical protein
VLRVIRDLAQGQLSLKHEIREGALRRLEFTAKYFAKEDLSQNMLAQMQK